jgi:nucleoid DNA-binding protein
VNRSQLINEVLDRTEGFSRKDVADIISVTEGVITETISGGEPVNLSGFAKFARKDTPAKPKRMGRNPATGEEMEFKAKPASVKVTITPLKALKDTVIAASAKKAKAKKKKSK